ncbi:hypothetical protein WDU94_005464 [Cyamophila willieti]
MGGDLENGGEEKKLVKQRKNDTGVIDAEVMSWFSKCRKLPISGPVLQEKAKQIAEAHGLNEFKASNGWLEKFSERDVFNADKTGLFFRVLPNKTMAFKNETCSASGGKVSKERLTVLLCCCCNMLGEFEKPLVIGFKPARQLSSRRDLSIEHGSNIRPAP